MDYNLTQELSHSQQYPPWIFAQISPTVLDAFLTQSSRSVRTKSAKDQGGNSDKLMKKEPEFRMMLPSLIIHIED